MTSSEVAKTMLSVLLPIGVPLMILALFMIFVVNPFLEKPENQERLKQQLLKYQMLQIKAAGAIASWWLAVLMREALQAEKERPEVEETERVREILSQHFLGLFQSHRAIHVTNLAHDKALRNVLEKAEVSDLSFF